MYFTCILFGVTDNSLLIVLDQNVIVKAHELRVEQLCEGEVSGTCKTLWCQCEVQSLMQVSEYECEWSIPDPLKWEDIYSPQRWAKVPIARLSKQVQSGDFQVLR